MNVAIVGLGVGGLACHAAKDDRWRFYEIDPAVVSYATDPNWFNYLNRCTPEAPIIVGDARLTLQDEPAGAFDVLVIDAFSSDAVPVHLMTREAVQGYFTKLKPDGVLVMHLTNQYMDLPRIVSALAQTEGLAARFRHHQRTPAEVRQNRFGTTVMVLAREKAHLQPWMDSAEWSAPPEPDGVEPWTDDYSNILSAILRKQGLR